MPRLNLQLNGTMGLLPASIGLLFSVTAVGAFSQDTGSQRAGSNLSFSVVPRLSVTETFTDNVSLVNTGRRAEQITDISPGIVISGNSGRTKVFVDYSLHETLYAQNSSGRRSQNALNASGTVEAVENWAYLDFGGNISQQAISAFGAQSPSNLSINPNLAETRSFRLSPYLRGKLSTFADYEARYSLATSRSPSALASDVTTNDAVVKLNGRSPSANLGWAVDASRQNTDYRAGRSTQSDRFNATLTYPVNPQLNFSVTGGQEANNFTSLERKSSFTSGFGINWAPWESTKLSASRQNRSFGESHTLSFEHRTPRTVWRFSDTKDISVTPSGTGLTGLGSTYDLYFAQFASIEPDPVLRAALVSNFLQANGINPNISVVSGFLTSAASLQRRQDISFALLGLRDTVTFIANRSQGSRLDTIAVANDDLANSGAVRQNGVSVSYAHRLTPDASLNVLASVQKATDGLGLQSTSTKSVNLSLSTRLTRRSTAVLSARRVVFESNTSPYTESAITGALNVQF